MNERGEFPSGLPSNRNIASDGSTTMKSLPQASSLLLLYEFQHTRSLDITPQVNLTTTKTKGGRNQRGGVAEQKESSNPATTTEKVRSTTLLNARFRRLKNRMPRFKHSVRNVFHFSAQTIQVQVRLHWLWE
jgi:hypothetical protein